MSLFDKVWNVLWNIPFYFNLFKKSFRGEENLVTDLVVKFPRDNQFRAAGGVVSSTDDWVYLEYVFRGEKNFASVGFNVDKSQPSRYIIKEVELEWREFFSNPTPWNIISVFKTQKKGPQKTQIQNVLVSFDNASFTHPRIVKYYPNVIVENDEAISCFLLSQNYRPLNEENRPYKDGYLKMLFKCKKLD